MTDSPSADDTIFALSTPPGLGSIAVVRLSGPAAQKTLLQVITGTFPPPRRASLRVLRDPATSEVLDRGLVLWFPAPSSFTGEDVVELQVHGGRAVVTAMLAVLTCMPGLRPAEPGEFSRRAFFNDRMDLTAAEGLADLVAAETEAQRRQALQQMDGVLARLYESWRMQVVRLLAHLEAAIDFPDEDLPHEVETNVYIDITELAAVVRAHLDDNGRGERIRNGIHLVLVGPPNAGKSSLFNLLVGREAAIVSAIAGTTRDVLEVHMDLNGYPIVLTDTAGIRPVVDIIEIEGVRRALARAAMADLKLVVLDGEKWPNVDAETRVLIDDRAVILLNKADLLAKDPSHGQIRWEGQPVVLVSALQGIMGLRKLEQCLQSEVERRWGGWMVGVGGGGPPPPILTRLRHRSALQDCLKALERAPTASLPELAAEDLRIASRALGRITGRITVEEVLDVVFQDFCIGK